MYEELSSKSNVKYIAVELNQSSSVDASNFWSKQLHGIHWERKIWRSNEERCYNSWCQSIGAIFAATDHVCTLQVLNQDEMPLLYSLVFGEGVVNDTTPVVLFNAIPSFDLTHLNHEAAVQFLGNFLYLFILSTLLGVATGLISACH